MNTIEVKMNTKQRVVLFSTAVILALMLLFPPFYGNMPDKFVENKGYHFILTPPEFTYVEILTRIDFGVLFVQYLFIITIGGILCFAFKGKDS